MAVEIRTGVENGHEDSERDASRCGRCDVCRAEAKIDPNSEEADRIKEKIHELLMSDRKTLDKLVEASGYASEKVLPVVEWMVEQGIILREKDLKFRWNGPRS